MIKRTQIVVRRGLQLNFVAKLMVLQIVTTLILYMALQQQVMTMMDSAATSEVEEALSILMQKSFYTLMGVSAISAFLVAMLGLWFSNRIMGPIPRFISAFNFLKSGDYTVRLKLRPGDTLEEIATAFNETAEALEQKNSNCEEVEALIHS